MNSHYKTVFFDWGGVIADDPGDEFLGQILKQIGATDEQIQEISKAYMPRFMRGQISESEYWNALRSNYGLEIHDSISDEFKKWSGLVANQDVLALVEEAKSQGLQVAVLSNVIEPTYKTLQQAGYYDLFDGVIGSCEVGLAKPQVEIYELALSRMKTTADRSIFIDDKQKNLDPAAKMGFTTILAKSPTQIIEDTRALLLLQ